MGFMGRIMVLRRLFKGNGDGMVDLSIISQMNYTITEDTLENDLWAIMGEMLEMGYPGDEIEGTYTRLRKAWEHAEIEFWEILKKHDEEYAEFEKTH